MTVIFCGTETLNISKKFTQCHASTNIFRPIHNSFQRIYSLPRSDVCHGGHKNRASVNTALLVRLYTVKNKGFHRGFLRVFTVSLKENLFVAFIKTFSQKNSHKVFIKNLSYQWFCEKVLMKTTKRFSFRDTVKNLRKPHGNLYI